MFFLTVGHLPREVSQITKFLLDRGPKVTATLTSAIFCRSAMVQGGLEITCKVPVKMPATIKNHMILNRFKELVKDYYTEPTDEETLVLSWQSFVLFSGTNTKISAISKKKEKMVKSRNKRTRH